MVSKETNEVFIKLNNSGTLVEGGGIFSVGQTEVCLGVSKKVMSDSTAVGSLVIGSTVMDDITMTAPINKLSTAKLSTVGRKEKQALGQYSIINRKKHFVIGPFWGEAGGAQSTPGKIAFERNTVCNETVVL